MESYSNFGEKLSYTLMFRDDIFPDRYTLCICVLVVNPVNVDICGDRVGGQVVAVGN